MGCSMRFSRHGFPHSYWPNNMFFLLSAQWMCFQRLLCVPVNHRNSFKVQPEDQAAQPDQIEESHKEFPNGLLPQLAASWLQQMVKTETAQANTSTFVLPSFLSRSPGLKHKKKHITSTIFVVPVLYNILTYTFCMTSI